MIASRNIGFFEFPRSGNKCRPPRCPRLDRFIGTRALSVAGGGEEAGRKSPPRGLDERKAEDARGAIAISRDGNFVRSGAAKCVGFSQWSVGQALGSHTNSIGFPRSEIKWRFGVSLRRKTLLVAAREDAGPRFRSPRDVRNSLSLSLSLSPPVLIFDIISAAGHTRDYNGKLDVQTFPGSRRKLVALSLVLFDSPVS